MLRFKSPLIKYTLVVEYPNDYDTTKFIYVSIKVVEFNYIPTLEESKLAKRNNKIIVYSPSIESFVNLTRNKYSYNSNIKPNNYEIHIITDYPNYSYHSFTYILYTYFKTQFELIDDNQSTKIILLGKALSYFIKDNTNISNNPILRPLVDEINNNLLPIYDKCKNELNEFLLYCKHHTLHYHGFRRLIEFRASNEPIHCIKNTRRRFNKSQINFITQILNNAET